MKFGIAISNMQRGLVEKLGLLIDIVIEAEKLGYDSFLITDHYMLPFGNETLETWAYLSFLAGKVSNIKLGTCVTPISFRPPSLLAKTISTLDLVSNGRVIVGVGLGWYPDEYEAYSSWDPNPVRFEKTKEALELMVKLWSEDKVNFEGKHYRVKGAVLQPKPVQKPHPPLWFGGSGKKMLKLAATMGNGWITPGPRWAPICTGVEEYMRCVEKIKRYRESLGKNEKFTFACLIAPDESFEEFAREIEAYRKAGMEYLVLGITRVRDGPELVKRFKNEIAPSFS
jgi:alkanesulfonate monooxygenase SsuD/methylene tetrahydromethanopterin reductase-like flavin-dependent oxidoreductase (luciferase family)